MRFKQDRKIHETGRKAVPSQVLWYDLMKQRQVSNMTIVSHNQLYFIWRNRAAKLRLVAIEPHNYSCVAWIGTLKSDWATNATPFICNHGVIFCMWASEPQEADRQLAMMWNFLFSTNVHCEEVEKEGFYIWQFLQDLATMVMVRWINYTTTINSTRYLHAITSFR